MELFLPYETVKSRITSKNLFWQYEEYNNKYVIYAQDNNILYYADIYLEGFEPNGLDVTQNTDDRTDFETYYKGSANQPTISNVGITKPFLTRAWLFSQNFCDKTTWYGDSVLVTDEAVGTGDDVTTVFNLDNFPVIDITHGKITDEDNLETVTGIDYKLHVFVNAVEQTEQELGGSGGDWTADYDTGEITFAVAPANGLAITATYYYATTSTSYIRPPTGKILNLTQAEAQFSADMVMTNNLVSAIYTYNPGLGAPPAKFEYPGSKASFKNIRDFINWTYGSFPIVNAMGGATRGFTQNTLQLRFDYVSPVSLSDAYGAEMRLWSNNDTVYNGEYAAITFYGYVT